MRRRWNSLSLLEMALRCGAVAEEMVVGTEAKVAASMSRWP